MTADSTTILSPYELIGRNAHPLLNPSVEEVSEFFWKYNPRNFAPTGLTGKWCMFKTADEVDSLWNQVCAGVDSGKFSAAICSAKHQAAIFGGSYLIAVYNESWENKADVDRVREALRGMGVSEELGYKRDIETFLQVYGSDKEWYYRG